MSYAVEVGRISCEEQDSEDQNDIRWLVGYRRGAIMLIPLPPIKSYELIDFQKLSP